MRAAEPQPPRDRYAGLMFLVIGLTVLVGGLFVSFQFLPSLMQTLWPQRELPPILETEETPELPRLGMIRDRAGWQLQFQEMPFRMMIGRVGRFGTMPAQIPYPADTISFVTSVDPPEFVAFPMPAGFPDRIYEAVCLDMISPLTGLKSRVVMVENLADFAAEWLPAPVTELIHESHARQQARFTRRTSAP